MARAADHIQRALGVVVFFAGLVLAALAPSVDVLIVARVTRASHAP